MRIEEIIVSPLKDSFNPEIQFDISFLITRDREIPIQVSGRLLSDEKKKIANLYELVSSGAQYNLEAESSQRKDEMNLKKILVAPLNRKILDYLESRRIKNEKNDVIFTLEMCIRILKSTSLLSSVIALETQPFELPPKGKPVIYDYSDTTLRRYNDLWLISGNNSPKFLEIREQIFSQEVRISASDWIHDYCPVFDFGRFLVFELPVIDIVSESGTFEKKVNLAIESLGNMEQNMREGEWNDVMNYSRGISELFRDEEGIKDIFIRNQYGEKAYKNFNESIKQLFNFASKFHHKLDHKDKTILPETKASKEDAYLIFSLSVAIVNNILAKIKRLGIKPNLFEKSDTIGENTTKEETR